MHAGIFRKRIETEWTSAGASKGKTGAGDRMNAGEEVLVDEAVHGFGGWGLGCAGSAGCRRGFRVIDLGPMQDAIATLTESLTLVKESGDRQSEPMRLLMQKGPYSGF